MEIHVEQEASSKKKQEQICKASEHLATIFPQLVEYIRERYFLQFPEPRIEIDMELEHAAAYRPPDNCILMGDRQLRSTDSVTMNLAHEFGHALLHTKNPFFNKTSVWHGDFRCIDEGIAQIIQKESLTYLEELGAYHPRTHLQKGMENLKNFQNQGFYKFQLQRGGIPYTQGKKSILKLMGNGMGITDIIERAADPFFAVSIPHSCEAAWREGLEYDPYGFIRWMKVERK